MYAISFAGDATQHTHTTKKWPTIIYEMHEIMQITQDTLSLSLESEMSVMHDVSRHELAMTTRELHQSTGAPLRVQEEEEEQEAAGIEGADRLWR